MTAPSGQWEISADYNVFAVPVEVMAKLVTPVISDLDPSLRQLGELARHTRWMSGIQFFLDRRIPIVRGHVIYPDAEFGLTSISQAQFWPDFDFNRICDGRVKDILSVDISDWEENGLSGKPAKDLEESQIRDEVWAQLQAALNRSRIQLPDESRLNHFLDDSITPAKPGVPSSNTEPLLINYARSWEHRPKEKTGFENMFLAADYVQTYTDLATMESACEAGRRAVNAILDAAGGSGPTERLKVEPLPERAMFVPLRLTDELVWRASQDHLSEWDPVRWAQLTSELEKAAVGVA